MNAFGSPNGLSDICSEGVLVKCFIDLVYVPTGFVCNKFNLSIYENLQKWMNPEVIN